MTSSELNDNRQWVAGTRAGHQFFWPLVTVSSVIGFAVIVLVAYQRSIFGEYGRLDDFVVVLDSRLGGSIGDLWFAAGRLIPWVFGSWLFSYVDSVGGLVFPRIISALMVSMGGAATALLTLRLIPRKWTKSAVVLAASAGVVAISIPASPNVVTWAIQAVQMVALPTAMAAGILATSERSVFGHHWALSSGVLIIISAFSYQQFPMLALLPTLLWSATRWARQQVPHWGRSVIVAIMCTTALGVNWLFISMIENGDTQRAFGHRFSQYLDWFIEIYLPRTVDVFVPSSPRRAAVSTVLIVILLMIPLFAGVRYLALSLAVLISWMACSLVAFPTSMWASYRLLYPAQLALWAGASVAAAVSLVDSGSRYRLVPRIGAVVFVVVSLFSLAVAEFRAYAYIALPNSIDWASTRCVVANAEGLSGDTVLVGTDISASRSAVISYDEYGYISSGTWSLPFMVSLAQYELNEAGVTSSVSIKIVSDEAAKGLTGEVLRITQDICGTIDD